MTNGCNSIVFNFVTLFPKLVEGYFQDSILGRAVEQENIVVNVFNPRDYTNNKHLKVDDTIAGGGAGMLLSLQPFWECLSELSNTHIVFLSPSGKPFKTKDAKSLSAVKDNITLVCGRYEGFDERIIELFADEVYSVGDCVLTGGELPALCVCDGISRHVEGVLGSSESLCEESFEGGLLESPLFTKPRELNGVEAPAEFFGGNHRKITQLKHELSLKKTQFFRNDLYLQHLYFEQ